MSNKCNSYIPHSQIDITTIGYDKEFSVNANFSVDNNGYSIAKIIYVLGNMLKKLDINGELNLKIRRIK